VTPTLNEVLVYQPGHIRQEERIEFEQGGDAVLSQRSLDTGLGFLGVKQR